MDSRCVEWHSCLYLLSDSQAPLFLTDSICVALPGMWSDEPYYAIHLASNSHCRQLRTLMASSSYHVSLRDLLCPDTHMVRLDVRRSRRIESREYVLVDRFCEAASQGKHALGAR